MCAISVHSEAGTGAGGWIPTAGSENPSAVSRKHYPGEHVGSNLNETIGLTGADSAFAPNVIVPGYKQEGTTTQQRFQVPTLANPVIDHITVIGGVHQFKVGAEYCQAGERSGDIQNLKRSCQAQTLSWSVGCNSARGRFGASRRH
ncbi:MAG: hypothetical protein ABSC93_06935 [Bryobacteraceae bacterium]